MSRYRRIRPRNTRNPTPHVWVTSGNEGPRHDPYAWQEFSYNGWVIHYGLDTYLEHDGQRVHARHLVRKMKMRWPDTGLWQRADRILTRRWERHAGTTIAAVLNFMGRQEPDPMGCLADYE